MKNYLILVKHSLPEIIQDRPAREWHLSEEGIQRAQRLAARLSSYQPELLVSSAEPKARETAEIISHKLKIQLQIVENLHEHDRTRTPYLSGDEFHQAVREFFRKPDALVFGSETADQAHERFSRALGAVLEMHKDKTIVAVAHGTVIALFVSRLTGIPDLALWDELGLPSYVALERNSNTLIAQENIL